MNNTRRTYKPVTLEDTLVIASNLFIADKAYYSSLDSLQDALQAEQEWHAEQAAENAWLRHAESAGWQELAYLEQHAPWAI